MPDVEPQFPILNQTECSAKDSYTSIHLRFRKVFPDNQYWAVESWEPLTVSPSLLCTPDKGGCGDHGFIKQGRWVLA